MNNLSTFNSITMTSQEIADLVDVRHDSVKRTIELLATKNKRRDALIQLPQVVEVKNHLGQAVANYVFSGEQGKRDSYIVVAQLSPEFTARLVDRWQELENQLAPQLPQTYAEALRQLADKHEQLQLTEQQRDNAIRTKAEIGSRREATSMATASAAVRKANKLQIELDRSLQYASIKRVEILTGGRYDWRKLKDASNNLELEIEKVFDQNYGAINAYHADAWLSAYGLDINNL